MSCLGVHFALTEEQVMKLRALEGNEDRLDFLQEEIESHFFEGAPEFKAESDKAWDAMHRALTDGELSYTNGTYPLNHVVLGGEVLYFEDDYIMSLKTPDQVAEVAHALSQVSAEAFREMYFKIDPESYGVDVTEDDFQYTWGWFEDQAAFWQKAASEARYVLFTADQ